MFSIVLILLLAGCYGGVYGGVPGAGYYGAGAGRPGAYYGAGAVARPYYAGPYDESPKPYDFSYVAPAIGGQSTRKETGDASGRVVGSYTLNDDDGRSRVVEYVADAAGFRATVKTNEPGTKSENPADVSFISSAPDPHSGAFAGQYRQYTGRYAGQAAHAVPSYGAHPAGKYAAGSHAYHGPSAAHRYHGAGVW